MKKSSSVLVLCLFFFLPLSNCSSEKTGFTKQNPAYNYVAEGRGVWGGGDRRGGNIDSTMKALADAGINMIYPNISSGGRASYPSSVLPMRGDTDRLALLIEAAHKYGIEVHAWRINWYMGGASDSLTEEMIKQGRIQYSWDGRRNGPVMKDLGYDQPEDWLCPSHPANRELEKEAMLELVRNYDVDGVHFDYMRYSNDHFCYCDGCKERFSEAMGLTIENWPDPVWKEGELREVYLEWRRNLIHTSAREIARAVHTLDPYVCVSLAARSSVSWCTYSDGQEWWKWMNEGILDFVCPMNYTVDTDRFAATMKSHLPLAKGMTPYYSGLGVYRMDSYDQLAANANAGRARGHDGWIAFNQRGIMHHLDKVREGINRKPALLPHRAPEVRWRFAPGTGEDAPQGYPRYSVDAAFEVDVSVMFKAKLREGINRIRGDFCLVSMEGEVLEKLKPIDLNASERLKLVLKYSQPGRYRLALYGTMTLSTDEEKPFIAKSFPFETCPEMGLTWPDRVVRGANISSRATEEDIAHYAKEWNGYAVRILVNSITAEEPPYAVSEERKARIFNCLDNCLKYNLLTVFSPSASFRDNDKFFSNQQWLEAFKDFWREVATRYQDKGPIVYDLINEPWGEQARKRWNSYARELTAAIREIDTVHTIMVVPPEWGWANGFQYLEPTGDKNTVYSFHFYGPMDYTHQRNRGHMRTTEEQWRERVYPGFLQGEQWGKERLRQEVRIAAEWRDKYSVRMWCGEYGVARWARGAMRWTRDWIDVLEEEKIGWAYYEYRGWQHMDMEMDSTGRKETPRSETDFVRFYKKYFARTD